MVLIVFSIHDPIVEDSFGGSALCLMATRFHMCHLKRCRGSQVTCISPAFAFSEETVNSLNYAQKAMNIQNTPILQLDVRSPGKEHRAYLKRIN